MAEEDFIVDMVGPAMEVEEQVEDLVEVAEATTTMIVERKATVLRRVKKSNLHLFMLASNTMLRMCCERTHATTCTKEFQVWF